MKTILVTGKTGGISNGFKDYLSEYFPNDYKVTIISLRDEKWKGMDLGVYDAIYHCAGLVSGIYEDLERVNVKISEELFRKAVGDGVKKFIYLSSMAVYSLDNLKKPMGGVIGPQTPLNGHTAYGRSKIKAEECLRNLETKDTKLAIIRAPSVFGRKSEQVMEMYAKALRLPIFPLMFDECKRGLIYIDCLSEMVRLIVENGQSGIYCPQNLPLYSTSEIIRELKQILNSRTILFNIPRFLQIRCKFTNRRFGNQCYTDELSRAFENAYCIFDTKTAIQKSLSTNGSILR